MFAGKVTWCGDLDPHDRISLVFGGPREATDPVLVERTADALFAHRRAPLASWYGEAPVRGLWRERQWLGVADARLDNRDELGAMLGLSRDGLASTSDAALVCRVVTRWGDAGLARILGAFAFAIWDTRERRLLLGRDCIGHRTLFYHVGQGRAAFASNLNTLFAMPGVPRTIDDIGVVNFTVYNLLAAPERTLYRDIARVPSRNIVAIDANGVRRWPYWRPDPLAAADCKSDEDYIARGRDLFDAAVHTATRGLRRIAIATSGGLDSSAMAATAARLHGADAVDCYTVVPPDDFQAAPRRNTYLDERPKLDALVRRYPGLTVHAICPEGLHAFDRDWTLYYARTGLPASGPDGFSAFDPLLDDARADGHDVILLGGFGNHGMTWGGTYHLLELLRSGRLARFARELSAQRRASSVPVAAILRSMVARPAASPGMRRAIARLRGRDPFDTARRGALNPSYIASAQLPSRWRAEGFSPLGHLERSGAAHRARWHFDFNQFGRDARALLPERCGMEMRDPYTDRRLAEFLIAVPERLFRRDGVDRMFARRVFADRLPPDILDETRLGAQNVGWFRHLDARRADIVADLDDIAQSSRVRRLLDLPRLERLVADWPADEAAAQPRMNEYLTILNRGLHIGRFIRWAEGANR